MHAVINKNRLFSEKIQLSNWGPIPIDLDNWSSTVTQIQNNRNGLVFLLSLKRV